MGTSQRWATVAVLLLGMAACSLGSARSGAGALGALGAVSLVLTVAAIVTGSLPVLTLAVAAFVALWAGSTLRHTLAGSADRDGVARSPTRAPRARVRTFPGREQANPRCAARRRGSAISAKTFLP